MPETWTHPVLGEFVHNEVAWLGQTSGKAFALFPIPGDDEEIPKGSIELAFVTYPNSENDPPSDAHVKVMLELLAMGETLAPKILDAMWNDIQGTGPSSGAWWSGCLDDVNEAMDWDPDFEPITEKETLRKTMVLSTISIGHYHDPDAVDICFSTPWEDEHGLGFLIRDGEVAGIGYGHEPQAFEG